MSRSKNALEKPGQRIPTGGSNCWNLNHHVVGQAVAVCVDGPTGIPWMAVGYKDLRVIEWSALMDDPIISQGFQESDDCVNLIKGQRGDTERLDDRAVERLDRSHISAAAVHLNYLTQSKNVAIVEVRRRESHVSERGNLERAVDTEALGYHAAVEVGGWRTREESARQREWAELVARTYSQVVFGWAETNVVKAFVDNV